MNPNQVITQHLETQQIPCVAWAFGHIGSLELGCTGRLWHMPDAPVATQKTVFDLASLTKVLVTVPLLLKAIEAGKLDPNAPLFDTLPEIRGLPLETATMLELVSHTSGLAAMSPLRTWGLPRQAALQKALEMPRTESGIVYSDQGYLVLTYLLEKIYGVRLDVVAHAELFAPLGINLTYHPDPSRCAATELGKDGSLIIGQVHDENTRALDGISGHAGLFGSLLEVTAYMQALMSGQVVSEAMLRVMQHQLARAKHDARAFGWLLPHANWLGADNSPLDTLGHTGFTGTGIWFSLVRQQLHILLTNRVCPSRDTPNDIAGLRRRFNHAAWELFKIA